MSRFRNVNTGVVVSVDDSKDGRYGDGYELVEEPARKASPKKSINKSSK